MTEREDEERLRATALENARATLAARRRAEEELRAAKEALREAAEFNSRIVESSRDCIKVLDLEGRLLSMSQAGQRLLGITDLAPFLGKSWLDFWQGEEREAAEAALRGAAAGRSGSLVGFFPALDGSPRWWDVVVTPMAGADGRPEKLLAVSRDITDRWTGRQALEAERHGLEILNATGLKFASEVDQQSLVQAVTDAARELCGAKFGAFFYNVVTPRGEAYKLFTLSGAPREAFEKFGLPRATPVFKPTFMGEGPVRCDDITTDPRYGRMAPHHGMPEGHLPVRSYLAVPVRSRSGEVLGGLFFGHPQPGVFNERAERLVSGIAAQAAVALDNARLYESERRARAEAELQSELKDHFLATLSHELRTPLGAILGWAQVIAARPMEPGELAHAMQVIERNARAQTRLIEDLLDMSRITSGKVRLDIQPLYPAALVETSIETVRPAAEAKGVRIESVLDPKAGPVSGDPSRLQQVVWNLLSNALKFTPRGGKVQVRLQRVNSHIELSVADTGIGIRADFLPHVFDRFRQADGSSTRGHGGLGIGLSIARHLVELHGGTLRAASLGEGRGATFTVDLPLNAVHANERHDERMHPASPPQDERPIAALPDLSGLFVLAVDDHADARELLRRVLEDCGARVATAGSVAQAIAALAGERPHVIVSDIGMPGADGFDFLKRVRKLGAEAAAIPVIALTAFARAEDRVKVLRAGFRLHVAKPVEPAELCMAVASAAGRAG